MTTGVQNHDTGSTQNHWPFPSQYLHQARSSACLLACMMLCYVANVICFPPVHAMPHALFTVHASSTMSPDQYSCPVVQHDG